MYRGEQFSVIDSCYKNKREEIGVEIVDLLLGFIRQIIRNEIVPYGLSEEDLKTQKLKGKKAKNDIAIELLKNDDIFTFFSNIKYYEWESNNELKERSFSEYLKLFMVTHTYEFRSEEQTDVNKTTVPKKRRFGSRTNKPSYYKGRRRNIKQ
jgi:hypothetical protein